MSERVDARGLSCPQPVLMALSKMKELGAGEIEVLVDNPGSRENVSRAATKQGWEVAEVKEEAEEYHLLLKR
jgi:tRNA 2-thiouridine synthesizing protein A